MNEIQNPETMPRGQFLRQMGLSSAALMAFYCIGTTSCKNTTEDPTPVTPVTPVALTGNAENAKGAINCTLDLTTATYSALKTEGKFAIVGDLMVAKVKGGAFVALSKACTHQGNIVEYRLANDDVWCSAHGSVFKGDGTVKTGPATKALTVYKTTLSTDGNKLTVVA